MADENEEFRKILLQIEALNKARKNRAKTGLSITTEWQELIDSESAALQSWRDRLNKQLLCTREWFESAVFRFSCGFSRPPLDEEAKMLLDDLRAHGKLSDDEWRACVQWRIARRAKDNVLEVVGPPRQLMRVGKITAVTIAIAIAYSIESLLSQFFSVPLLAYWGFVIGAVLSKILCAIYYSTWGWKALAFKLRYACPFFRSMPI
jgi:hypothetical protein